MPRKPRRTPKSDDPLRQRVASNLRYLRKKSQETRADVARRLPEGSGETSLYRWETGRHMPEQPQMEALARAYKISVERLYSEDLDPDARRSAVGAAEAGDLRHDTTRDNRA